MVELIPSILVESEKEFERRLRLVDAKVKTIHIDILDGTIFPHVSWYDPQTIGDIMTNVRYEIHLMVENPLPIIAEWKKHVPTLFRAIIQAELDRPVGLVLEQIKQTHKLETCVAISPETPVKTQLLQIPNLDSVLIMGVHPGASGQTFLADEAIDKIRLIRAHSPNLPIACDGGITLDNAETIIQAGCTRLITASAIFNAPNTEAALTEFLARVSQF